MKKRKHDSSRPMHRLELVPILESCDKHGLQSTVWRYTTPGGSEIWRLREHNGRCAHSSLRDALLFHCTITPPELSLAADASRGALGRAFGTGKR
jgi:hypothetical protein